MNAARERPQLTNGSADELCHIREVCDCKRLVHKVIETCSLRTIHEKLIDDRLLSLIVKAAERFGGDTRGLGDLCKLNVDRAFLPQVIEGFKDSLFVLIVLDGDLFKNRCHAVFDLIVHSGNAVLGNTEDFCGFRKLSITHKSTSHYYRRNQCFQAEYI